MEDSNPMTCADRAGPGTRLIARRTSGLRAGLTLVALVGVATLAGCPSPDGRQPTVSSVNFTPKLVLEVNDEGFDWRRGPREDPGVTIPEGERAPTVDRGTVINIVNTGQREHWVEAGKSFDSGRMKPGERMVVALTEEITDPKTIDIVDRDTPEHKTQLNLVPQPGG